MFENLDYFLITYGFVVISLSFIIKGLVGFGEPMVYQPILSVYYDNKIITPALGVSGILSNAIMTLKNRKKINLKLVLPITAAVLMGDIPGILFLKQGAPQIIKVLLGFVIIIIGIEMFTRKEVLVERKINMPLLLCISVFSGFTAGLFGINLFFVAYLERVIKDRGTFTSSICFVFLTESVFRFFMGIANGLFVKEVIILAIISLPAAYIGLRIGFLLDKKLGDKISKKFMIIIFIIGGISTVVNTYRVKFLSVSK